MQSIEQMNDERISVLARKLRLGNVSALYRGIDFKDPRQFTCALMERLVAAREKERSIRNQKQAGFESVKTLDDFSFDCVEMPAGCGAEWLRSGAYIKERTNLVMIGNSGTGKTHLATALGIEACRLGYKTFYRRTSKLIEELTRSNETGHLAEYTRRLEQKDLLIFDEWGYLPVHTDGMRLLFDVIADAYERRSIILTTNLPFDEWNKIFHDERLLLAMTDRLYHHALVINHTGESYRVSHSLMRSFRKEAVS